MKIRSERLARLKLLLGDSGLDKLEDSTVMVLGLGGVGSACAEALARGGVGTLILLDRDVVEESNINRQALAFTSTLGQKKAEVMQRMVYEINPDIITHAQPVFLTPQGIAETLDAFPRPDYVVDCIDTVSQKLNIAGWCADRELPLLSSMGAANKLDPTYLEFANIRKTINCPLSKVVRTECRKRRIKGLEVLYSTEVPVKRKNSTSRSKGENLGSMSYMPPIMGQMLAGKVIRRLAGMEAIPRPPRRYRSREEALAAAGIQA
ncbi:MULTISPECIES: ThiF family adenylyltransferase [unclassified Corynebacterium]|uniref:tRNA threonylcarbamoyladenosine dehydratase n=1 Tax=unclassified Corynebacterium TaxID=2624378 RepID=UPI001CE402CA|nr:MULTISPECIES: tRNA threonylcarbamoyladenosine dehydratase [unclassified Corynebacterium]